MKNPLTEATTEEVALMKYIRAQTEKGRTLRQIAKDYPKCITFGDIQRILKGVFPLRMEKRLALGLPIYSRARVCTACGQVHAFDRACQMTVTLRKPRKPRRQAHQFGWLLKYYSDDEVREMVGLR